MENLLPVNGTSIIKSTFLQLKNENFPNTGSNYHVYG